jgi:UDP-GlcNAc3NAcA epimerase
MSRFLKESGTVQETLVHTGQHFDFNMSEVFFSGLGIPAPRYNLGINTSSHGNMTGKMLIGIEEILLKETCDYVLVYGDTNSTLAGALAAKKLHIPVIHVEAGLRSFNNRMPEEINRIITDRISDLLCCPTDVAMKNLKAEGFDHFRCTYLNTGDILHDAVRFQEKLPGSEEVLLAQLGLSKNNYILATIHRPENTDDPERMKNILEAWAEIAKEISIVVPLHPRTKNAISILPPPKGVHFIDPVGYADNLQLMKFSSMVMTDSGGMQKEAYMLKKFCLTLRDETEWTELVDSSCNFVTGAEKEKIVATYHSVKKRKWTAPDDFYGGGSAALEIFNMIVRDATRRSIV